MSRDVQRKIFDQFFTTKPIGQGTGLGLAISRTIITEEHGGSLAVQSQAGEGTEFTIALPSHL
jgi:two-component system, NtrC family, sensor kinase